MLTFAWDCTNADPVPVTPLRCPISRCPTFRPRFSASQDLGGSVIHPGERWAVCRDSEGSPFALAADT